MESIWSSSSGAKNGPSTCGGRGQGSCWGSLPHPSPGVQEARDAESLTPQTPRKKDPASRAKCRRWRLRRGQGICWKPFHGPEATKRLSQDFVGHPFYCRMGPQGAAVRGHASSLLPVYGVCTFECSAPPIIQRWGASGDLGELGLDLNDTYICMSCSPSLTTNLVSSEFSGTKSC